MDGGRRDEGWGEQGHLHGYGIDAAAEEQNNNKCGLKEPDKARVYGMKFCYSANNLKNSQAYNHLIISQGFLKHMFTDCLCVILCTSLYLQTEHNKYWKITTSKNKENNLKWTKFK